MPKTQLNTLKTLLQWPLQLLRQHSCPTLYLKIPPKTDHTKQRKLKENPLLNHL